MFRCPFDGSSIYVNTYNGNIGNINKYTLIYTALFVQLEYIDVYLPICYDISARQERGGEYADIRGAKARNSRI